MSIGDSEESVKRRLVKEKKTQKPLRITGLYGIVLDQLYLHYAAYLGQRFQMIYVNDGWSERFVENAAQPR